MASPDSETPSDSAVLRQMVLSVSCFFLSGFLALALEICWIRKASLVFGAASFALSTVLAVFFGGLALGSYFFGRWSTRIRRPLRVYAFAEIGVGLLAAFSPWAFRVGDHVYGQLYPSLYESFAMLSLARFALVCMILLPPTILMGATLPLFCRQFVQQESRIARSVGLLYGINTLGAAVGCAVCGFLMIRYVGVDRTIFLCGGLNIAIGVFVLCLPVSRRSIICQETGAENARDHISNSSATPPKTETPVDRRATTLVPLLFFLTGFVALGNEVLWTRFLSLLMHNTVYTYTMTLMVVLLGIVLGSVVASRWMDDMRRRAFYFGAVQLAIGLSVMLALMLPASWWARWRDPLHLSSQLWLVLAVLLIPAILSGVSFPLAIRMVVANTAQAGRDVGRMAAINTTGGIAGALGIGFLVLPTFGLQATLWLTTLLSIGCGVAAWVFLERTTSVKLRATLIVASAVLWLAIPFWTKTELPASHLAGDGQLVDYREGLSSDVAVVRHEATLQLEIDRLWQGENHKTHQIMAAHIPMLLHHHVQRPPATETDAKPPSSPELSVLVLGIGPGQTARRFLMYPAVQRLDCVDIERELQPLLHKYFDGGWMNDARVRIIVDDGRNYVTHTDETYDVISIEVGQAFRPGVASFYTADFYREVKQRLRPNGIVSQFTPLGFFSHQTKEFQTVVRTFLEEFPNSVLWYNHTECLLLGSLRDRFEISLGRLEQLEKNAAVHEDLKYSLWGGPKYWLNQRDVFLAGYLMGPKGLRRLAGDAPVYYDDRPYLEYATNPHFSAADIPILQLIHSSLEPVSAATNGSLDASEDARTQEVRQRNLRDIAAATRAAGTNRFAARGDYSTAERLIQEALQLNDERVRLYSQRGITLLNQKRAAEAKASFEQGLRHDPHDFSCRWGAGRTCLLLGEIGQAQSHLRRAAEARPTFAQPWIDLAQALRRGRRHDEAMAAVEHAVEIAPGYAAAHREHGELLLREGKIDEAIVALQKAAALEPQSAAHHVVLALALQKQGDEAGAVDLLRVATAISPEYIPSRNSLAWLLATSPSAQIRRPQEAVQLAEQITQQISAAGGQQEPAILDTLAAAYAADGQFEKAVATSKQALSLAENNANVGLALGIRARLALYEQAKPFRERVSAP